MKAVAPTRSRAMRDALLSGVADRAFTTTDSVLALRAAKGNCDSSCVPTVLPLLDGYDLDTEMAARGVLGELPARRWQSDFWWKYSGDTDQPFPEPSRSRLLAALDDPHSDPEVRMLAFAFADRLGLPACPDVLRTWSDMRFEQVGADFNVCMALNHLSRASCDGPWLEAAMRWLPLDPTLSPRIVLREARRNPQAADAALAAPAGARLGSASALAQWLCGMTGAQQCYAAARSTLAASTSEEERVAAAWAWSQLAREPTELEELLRQAAGDVSPQVRETAAYGIERRRVREQAATSLH